MLDSNISLRIPISPLGAYFRDRPSTSRWEASSERPYGTSADGLEATLVGTFSGVM
jgi:hypothetical protein